ncbi:MAG TPA: hypothetical protein DDY91_14750 [Planctomycetaceae bacterium]|nr:hypothetical protein [Planctomycetaceae bacterium]
MRPSFRQLWSLYARNLFRKARGHRRRQRPGQTARIATEVLETRQLLSSRVADVLKGSSDTRITGTVYEDVNSNGVKDGSDNGVQGWVVYLDLDGSGTWNTDDVGDQEPSALTNVDGDFIINKLVPGTYRIAEVVQAGWSPTAAVSKEVVVLNKKETKTNFYNFAGGAVEGTVWNDLDQDGERAVDPETGEFLEPGLAGWTLFVDINNSNDLDAGDPVTTTDTNGLYRFENLPPQDYEVYQVLPDLWEPSEGYDIHQTAGIQALQVTSLDFANFSDFNGGLEGTIWNDLNYNGVRDVDPVTGGWTDPGLESWTVFLDLDWDGAYTDGEPTALTDEDGHYVFNSVPAGGYLVTEVLPADWNVGEYYSSSWYVDVSAGSTTVVPDFSNFTSLYGTITGTIWNDRFRDGARDVDVTGAYLDPGLVGWTVFLDLNHNLAFDAGEPNTTTDTNGVYTFPDLQVGDYEVFEVIPTGWETTLGYDFSQSVTVWSGAVSVASDFANYNLSATLPGTVSGIAWSDLNANGVRDTDGTGAFTDPGIAGRTVFIDLNSNGILDTTDRSVTTASDGTYTFSNVNPGTLTIIEVIPAGWSATNPSTAARTVVLRNAGAVAGVDFGTYARQEGVLAGTVYNDANASGSRDAGEAGLSGLTVWLDTNNNGVLDAGEPQTVTSEDKFFTPTVNEAGTWEFTHLPTATYTVRVQIPDPLSATPAGARSFTVSLPPAGSQTGLDTAARYRANEIHGTRYSDDNGNGSRDAGESGVSGATVYLDLDRDNIQDAGEPTTTTGSDGSYTFAGLTPGSYVVRDVIDGSHEHTYPNTTSGTLWPAGTSNPAVGNVSPTSITASLADGASHRQNVSLTLPGSGALTNMVDVFLLFDDTGSFTWNSPIVRGAFPTIIDTLNVNLPGVDLGFGVGRFEEYGNYAWEYSTGRPFILNQPIVSASTTGYMAAIQAALNRTTPGYGGDGPETDIEALYQLVTGRGFDGNNNGSVQDSGAAGLVSTQLNPGNSGDVPSFASFVADTANGMLPAAGNVGGGGFRAGALPIVLLATDIGFAYQPKGETSITGLGGLSLPVSDLTQYSRPDTPFNSGAGLQETITALNALGALVIGLGTNPEPGFDPRQGLEAISKLTGSINRSTSTIDNGTATPITPGAPLYFQIASGFASSVANGVVNAIQNAVTQVAMDLTLRASDPRVKIINHTGTVTSVGAGQTATFDVEFVGDGIPHRFDLQIVRAGTGVVMGSIPVVLGTPVPGDGYSFEDCRDGEIHTSVDFGSHAIPGGTNHAPTDLALSSTSLSENQPSGTTIGLLSATDPDAGDSFTYTLVGGDVAAFSISGNTLKSAASYDFESVNSYSITIRVQDAGGLTFDKSFTIAVLNQNEAPTSLTLSGDTVIENAPTPTVVGTLSSTDPDAGDSFSYSLVSGDTGSFEIVGNELRTKASFDFETQSSCSITVRTTDADGLTFDKVFSITITDANDAPTGVDLSGNTITENLPIGSTVGTFSSTDPDAGDSFTYSLVAGDTADFEIVGDELRTLAVFDYETRSACSVTVRTTDAGGLTFDKVFSISILNDNEAPTNVDLSGNTITENLPVGTTLGTLSSTDPDAGDSFTYSLIGGDTAQFEIVGNELRSKSIFDFESVGGYSVTVRTTDAGDLTFDRVFTITVLDANEAPTDVALSGTTITENLPIGTALGSLSSTDPDAGDSFTYSLVAGDTADFEIVGGELRSKAVFNFENKASYSVTVRTTDAGGLTHDKSFSISVLDANEAPTSLTLSSTSVKEKQAVGTVVGILGGTDPDSGDSLSFSLVGGDVSAFSVSGNELQTAAVFAHATQSAYSLTVRVADSHGLSYDRTFTISVLPSNEAPTNLSLSANSIAENQAVSTVIGTLTTTDPDAGDTFTYSLVSGDTAAFQIVGDKLNSNVVFDYETTASYSVTVRTTDAGGLIFDKSFSISILNVNEAPTSISLSGTSLAENLPAGTVIGLLTAADPDSGETFTWSSVAGDTTAFSIVGNELRSAIVFNYEAKSSYSLTVRATDAGGLTIDRTYTISILDRGGLPSSITLPTTALTYLENAVALQLNATATVTDPDTANFGGGSLRVSFQAGGQVDDRLAIRHQGTGAGQIGLSGTNVLYANTVIGSYSGGFTTNADLVVSLNSLATPTVAAALLANITFLNAGDNPTNSTRSIGFQLTDGTGEPSNLALRSVAVTPVNDIPKLTVSAGSVTYVENAAAVIIDSNLQATDADSPDFAAGVLTISFASGQATTDRLVIVSQGQISVSGANVLSGGVTVGTFTGGFTTNGPLSITFNPSATPAIASLVAQSIGFRNSGDNPGSTTRVVKFVVTDGDGGTSVAVNRSVNVTPVNDAPVITASTAVTSYTENAVPVVVDGSILLADADSANFDTGVLTVAVTAGGSVNDRVRIVNQGTTAGKIGLSVNQVLYGNVVIGTYSGGFTDNSALNVTFNPNASLAAVGALLKAIAFECVGDTPLAGTRTIGFTVSDGDGGTSATASKSVKVTAVNDIPVVTLASGSVNYVENDPALIVDSTMVIDDVDSPDFATGTLKVSIASGSVTTDRLVIVAEGTGAGQVGLTGTNITFGGVVVGTYSGGFTTSGMLTITFNASATPAIAQSVARRIGFLNAGDNPGATVRTISFILTDGDGGTSATKTRSVSVTGVNDGPTLGSFGSAVSYTENTAAGTIISSTITVTDPDSANFDTGILTVSLPVGATAADLLEIKHTGTAAGQVGVSGANVTYGGVVIGTFTGGTAGTSLVITFNTSSTLAAVQAVAKSVTFKVVGAISANSSRTVRFSLSDGDGGFSLNVDKTINVINV